MEGKVENLKWSLWALLLILGFIASASFLLRITALNAVAIEQAREEVNQKPKILPCWLYE